MQTNRTFRPVPVGAKAKLLEAAIVMIRSKGFAGTSVDDLCAAAGVTKGAFFHHFATKEALGVAAANFWSDTTGAFFREAPYNWHQDPLDRVMGYIDFRAELMTGPAEGFSCVAGTMVQEAFNTSLAIREACRASIVGNAAMLEADIEEAMALQGVTGVTARSLALYIQAVLQGGFVLAKAIGGADIARESVAHLKRYFEMLFNHPKKQAK
mgnify:CR=1 FL=1